MYSVAFDFDRREYVIVFTRKNLLPLIKYQHRFCQALYCRQGDAAPIDAPPLDSTLSAESRLENADNTRELPIGLNSERRIYA